MIVFFVFYVNSISGFFLGIFLAFYFGWKAEEIHNCFDDVVTRYAFRKGKFGVGSWKNKFSALENSWNILVISQ